MTIRSRTRPTRVAPLIGLVLGLAALGAFTPAALALDGDLFHKECHTQSGSGGACIADALLGTPYDLETAPDGKTAYQSSWSSPAGGILNIFDRDPLTGKLTKRTGQAGCFRDTPVANDCTDAESMAQPLDIQISPDGTHLYVAAYGSNGITIFDRDNATGNLTQKAAPEGCLKNGGDGVTCNPGRALNLALQFAPSPDFTSLYVTSLTGSGSIAILSVNSDGTLNQDQTIDGCVTESGQDQSGNACTDGTQIGIAFQIAVTPDGKNVYGVGEAVHSVTIFNRNTTTGALTQLNGTAGCITQAGSGGTCQTQAKLNLPLSAISSKDGAHIFILSRANPGSILTFGRNANNGTLTYKSCINEAGDGGCANGRLLSRMESGAVSPDGNALAVTNWDAPGGIALLDIDQATGVLTQRLGAAGCFSVNGNAQGGEICGLLPSIGGEGNVEWVGDTIVNYAAIGGGSVQVFDRDFGPICQDKTASVPFQTSAQVQLTCSDANNDTLTLQITKQPIAGNLGAIDDNEMVRYNPFSGFSGADTFEYTATGRGVTSAASKVSLTVQPPPVPPDLDLDNDGSNGPPGPDCNDANPAIKPNAVDIPNNGVDENCDLVDAKLVLESDVGNSWRAFTTFTEVVRLVATDVPKGGRVDVTCKGKGCPFKKRKRLTAKKEGNKKLTQLFNRKKKGSKKKKKAKLKLKTKIEVKITLPGQNAIGRFFLFTVRKGDVPKLTKGCLEVTTNKKIACP